MSTESPTESPEDIFLRINSTYKYAYCNIRDREETLFKTAEALLRKTGINPFFVNVPITGGGYIQGFHLGDRHWGWGWYENAVFKESIVKLMGALYEDPKFNITMAPNVFGYPKGTPWEKIVRKDKNGRNNVTRWLEQYKRSSYDNYQNAQRPGPEMTVFLEGHSILNPSTNNWGLADELYQMDRIENIDPKEVLGYMAISPLSQDPKHPFANGCSISMQWHPTFVGSGMGKKTAVRASLALLNYMHRLKSFNTENPNPAFGVAITHIGNKASQNLLTSMGYKSAGPWSESVRVHPNTGVEFEDWNPTGCVFDAEQHLEQQLKRAGVRLLSSVSEIPTDRDMRLTYITTPRSIFRALIKRGLEPKDVRDIVGNPYKLALLMNEYSL